MFLYQTAHCTPEFITHTVQCHPMYTLALPASVQTDLLFIYVPVQSHHRTVQEVLASRAPAPDTQARTPQVYCDHHRPPEVVLVPTLVQDPRTHLADRTRHDPPPRMMVPLHRHGHQAPTLPLPRVIPGPPVTRTVTRVGHQVYRATAVWPTATQIEYPLTAPHTPRPPPNIRYNLMSCMPCLLNYS